MLDPILYNDNAAKQLPPDIQDGIITYLDNLVDFRKSAFYINREMWGFYGETYRALIKFLDYLGIYVGYDWIGHRNKHFYITEQDVINQEDWMEQCADYDEKC